MRLYMFNKFQKVYLTILSSIALIRYIFSDIVVDNCAICRNHIMDLCKYLTENTGGEKFLYFSHSIDAVKFYVRTYTRPLSGSYTPCT